MNTPSVEEVVKALREHQWLGFDQTNAIMTQAADLLEAQAAALDPFGRAAAIQPPGCENWPDDKPNSEFIPGDWPAWGDFKRARSLSSRDRP
jgi:hypothetical protein